MTVPGTDFNLTKFKVDEGTDRIIFSQICSDLWNENFPDFDSPYLGLLTTSKSNVLFYNFYVI